MEQSRIEVYREMLEIVNKGLGILTAGRIHPDIPTIHNFCPKEYFASIAHHGWGVFSGRTPSGGFNFNAGGAMTTRDIEGGGWISFTPLWYDNEQVLQDLGYSLKRVRKALLELIEQEEGSTHADSS